MAVMGVQMAEVSIFVTPSWMSRALPGLTRSVILRPDSSEMVLVSLVPESAAASFVSSAASLARAAEAAGNVLATSRQPQASALANRFCQIVLLYMDDGPSFSC